MTICGKVIKGKQRGRILGFPTINIYVQNDIPSGVYISKTKINEKTYPSVTFIGNPETYNEVSYKSETYLLNFSQNVYDQTVTIHTLSKIRDSVKFSSQQELIQQIQKDILITQEFFRSNKV